MRGNQRRKDLFNYYSKNLTIYCPGYQERFICPICLNNFTSDDLDQLSIAHVLPEKLGGHVFTLSCAECDNKIGHEFNWHAVQEKKIYDTKNEAMYGRFIPKKGSQFHIMSKWDLTRSKIDIFPPSDDLPQDVWMKWIDEIRGNSKEDSPYEFTIECRMPSFVPTKRDISYIHSAFLMMFYEFGYEYVLSPNVTEIRRMFNGADLSWMPSKLVRSLRVAPGSHCQNQNFPLIGVVKMPEELCSFAIFFPSFNNIDSTIVAFLPGMDEDFNSFYANLSRIQSPNDMITVVYPTQIMHDMGTFRYHINISDTLSKNVANHLYHTIKKMDINSSNVSIQIRDRTRG